MYEGILGVDSLTALNAILEPILIVLDKPKYWDWKLACEADCDC